MEVVHNILNYKDLKIVQNSDWFNFSLDSVLLSNFVKIDKSNIIVDFCTGNAPIPLILSTRTNSKIYGIEIQPEIYDLANKSVNLNNKSEQIKILNLDIKNLFSKFPNESVDTITCNPPYFKFSETSNLNSNKIKSIARHEILLNLDDVFSTAKVILKNNGNIAIVHRTERLCDIIHSMRMNSIEPKRIQFIYPKKGKESNIVLVEGIKNGNVGVKILTPIYAHENNGNYSKEVKDMFN